MIHMIFYAPYPQIVPLIKQVFQERPDCNELEYEIVQDFYNNPLQDLNADVVIARGPDHEAARLHLRRAEGRRL